jgi:hypothetical protein
LGSIFNSARSCNVRTDPFVKIPNAAMKYLLWVTIITIAVTTTDGCHKSNNTHTPQGLTQNWRENSIYAGGFAGGTYTVPSDSAFILSLNTDSTYTYRRNGQTISSGTYGLVPYKATGLTDSTAIIFSDRPLYHYLIHLEKGQMKLTNMEIEAYPSSTYSIGRPSGDR